MLSLCHFLFLSASLIAGAEGNRLLGGQQHCREAPRAQQRNEALNAIACKVLTLSDKHSSQQKWLFEPRLSSETWP